MKKMMIKLGIVAVLIFAVNTMVFADTVAYNTYSGQSISFTYGGTNRTGIAAEIYITWNNVPTWSYCVDLDNYISNSSATAYYGGIGAPIALIDFKEAAWLIEKNWSSTLLPIQRAALQATIWNVIYNGNFIIGTTNGSTFEGYYNTYMTAMSDTNGFAAFVPSQYVYLDLAAIGAADTVQDQITKRVPEPASMLLFGLGLLGLAGLRRRFKK
jgi:hypothetical protein